MKKNIVCITLAFSLFSMNISANHIIVGSIEDMLFQADVLKTIKKLGIKGVFSNLGSFFSSIGSSKTTEEIATKKFLKKLEKVTVSKKSGPYPALPWRGLTPPPIVYEWLYGIHPSNILMNIKRSVKSSTYKLAQVSFDAKKNTDIMQPCTKMIRMLQTLKKNGHTIHLIANWNDTCFRELYKSNKYIFDSIFNGEIVISGQIKKVMAPSDMPTILQDLNIDVADAVYLFIQPLNIKGLNCIHCPYQNIKQVENDLKRKKIL